MQHSSLESNSRAGAWDLNLKIGFEVSVVKLRFSLSTQAVYGLDCKMKFGV